MAKARCYKICSTRLTCVCDALEKLIRSIGTPKRKVDQVDLDKNQFFVNFGKRWAFEFFLKSFKLFVLSLNMVQV